MSHAKLLFHTVRHLRPIQIFGRLWFRFYRPTLKEHKAPPLRPVTSNWVQGAKRLQSMIGPDVFRFLNEEGTLSDRESWNDPAREKLWLYNLHYFDDLNADGAAVRIEWHRGLIERWIKENPAGSGNGWEPYPLSLRIVNWIKWALQGNAMEPHWLDSLAMQARFLRKRLEYHLLGNHLFANAKALIFAGMYFSGEEAEEWLNKGLAILAREVPEQVLKDGGHFERSPMYHSIILEDLLDLINLLRAYGKYSPHPSPLPAGEGTTDRMPVVTWVESALRMRAWLNAMCHPDGEISFFNDSSLGIAPVPAELEAYADRLDLEEVSNPTQSIIELADSGYLRLEQGTAVALLDVGEIGPDYLPGHAHADTLSFEWSLFGQRVIVNSGISCYGMSDERLRQRGTAAHSTVEIDGENSSEVWGGFRVARRARPLGLKIKDSLVAVLVSCAHDGYRRLQGRPVHRRNWELWDGKLKIMDRIEGRFKRAVARYHLHPDISVQHESGDNKGILRLKGEQTVAWDVMGGKINVVESSWHPGFGRSMKNQMIEVLFEGAELEFILRWD